MIKVITLEDFSRQVLRPSVLRAIAQGDCDHAIVRADVLDGVADREILEAIKNRLIVMQATGKLQ